jgi:hypothetical protein
MSNRDIILIGGHILVDVIGWTRPTNLARQRMRGVVLGPWRPTQQNLVIACQNFGQKKSPLAKGQCHLASDPAVGA